MDQPFISRNLAYRIARENQAEAVQDLTARDALAQKHAERRAMLADLTTWHTRKLLKVLKMRRASESHNLYHFGCGSLGCDYCLNPDPPGTIHTAPTIDDLKAELAKRPHVPGVAEGKRLRREAAMQGRKGKNRPTRGLRTARGNH